MNVNVSQEHAALERLTIRELRARFAELFGEATLAGNRIWLVRRILWRMQALGEGDLTERARRRATELANDADLRVVAPALPCPSESAPPLPMAASETRGAKVQRSRPAVPPTGTVLVRVYKGQRLEVRVRADGFEHKGVIYASLSAVAQAITGSHWNGRLFFKLNTQSGGR